MQQRRTYSGVDKLILAAMINDHQQHAAATSHLVPGAIPSTGGIIPSGRGIGYLNNSNTNNTNNSFTQIPAPSNRSECELYRLLERANLLSYFGTFLNFGGDDVQQLCDADEEEFIEIMSLVGMTQKPLHVRRLQKALIEWRESRDMEISSMFRYSAAPAQHTQQHPHQTNYPISGQNNQSAAAPAPATITTTPIPPQAPQHQLPATPKSATKCPPTTPSITSSGPALTLTSESLYQLRDESPQSKHLTSRRVTSRESDHQYITPRDLLVGAPKRIRLLDSLHNRQQQIVETKQIEPKKPESDTCISMKIANSQDTSLSPKRRFEDLSDEEDGDNCSGDEDDIEVMDSSESDGTAG